MRTLHVIICVYDHGLVGLALHGVWLYNIRIKMFIKRKLASFLWSKIPLTNPV